MLRGAIKLVAQTRAKADICELIEVAAKASLADGPSQEMHLLREELDTIPSVSEDTLPKIAQLAEKIGTLAGAVLDATKVDDFVGVLLRHAEDSLDAAFADAAAAIVSLRSEWRRRNLAHLRAHKVAAASELRKCRGSLEAVVTAMAPEDGGVYTKIFSVSVRVAGALAPYEACKQKWHNKVKANTRFSTMEETSHLSALATVEMARTRRVDDMLKQLKVFWGFAVDSNRDRLAPRRASWPHVGASARVL